MVAKITPKPLCRCEDPLFLDFICCCLEWDPEARMTPSAALRHAWLRRRLPRPPNEKSDSALSATSSGGGGSSLLRSAAGVGNKVRVQMSDERSATLHSQHSNHSGKLPPVT